MLEHKCATEGCWHWQGNSIYCFHCQYGVCSPFSPEQRAQAEKEIGRRKALREPRAAPVEKPAQSRR